MPWRPPRARQVMHGASRSGGQRRVDMRSLGAARVVAGRAAAARRLQRGRERSAVGGRMRQQQQAYHARAQRRQAHNCACRGLSGVDYGRASQLCPGYGSGYAAGAAAAAAAHLCAPKNPSIQDIHAWTAGQGSRRGRKAKSPRPGVRCFGRGPTGRAGRARHSARRARHPNLNPRTSRGTRAVVRGQRPARVQQRAEQLRRDARLQVLVCGAKAATRGRHKRARAPPQRPVVRARRARAQAARDQARQRGRHQLVQVRVQAQVAVGQQRARGLRARCRVRVSAAGISWFSHGSRLRRALASTAPAACARARQHRRAARAAAGSAVWAGSRAGAG